MEFLPGDIVLVCGKEEARGADLKERMFEKTAKVMAVDNDVCNKLLEFFEDVDGHSGSSRGKMGHCWWVPKTKLTLIYRKRG